MQHLKNSLPKRINIRKNISNFKANENAKLNSIITKIEGLNQIIADQKGIKLEELAGIEEGAQPTDPAKTTSATVNETEETSSSTGFNLSPSELRSRADALYKEAARLRKQADEIDPPKKKAAKAAEAEA